MTEPHAENRAVIDVHDVAHTFSVHGTEKTAITALTFRVWQREFVGIVGPSGCGKSTIVRILAGLLLPTRGEVSVEGKVVRKPPDDLLVLFQQYEKSLLPWRTVESNIRFGLENRTLSRQERRRRVDESLEAVELADVAHHYPYQLSGGMQQRVAIARSLARRPKIMLMDEPFSSLDALTRADLQDLTLRLWAQYGQTVLFVTHDVDEAVYLSTRVLVLGRPAFLREDVQISLGPSRNQTTTRELPHFLGTRRYILDLIRNEPGSTTVESSAAVSA